MALPVFREFTAVYLASLTTRRATWNRCVARTIANYKPFTHGNLSKHTLQRRALQILPRSFSKPFLEFTLSHRIFQGEDRIGRRNHPASTTQKSVQVSFEGKSKIHENSANGGTQVTRNGSGPRASLPVQSERSTDKPRIRAGVGRGTHSLARGSVSSSG